MPRQNGQPRRYALPRPFRHAHGRPFLGIADNGKDQNGNDQQYPTRTVLDIESNQRAVVDALGRTVMRYDYDVLNTRIHQASMEAGERWMLNDVTGKPIRGWNSRKCTFQTEYDRAAANRYNRWSRAAILQETKRNGLHPAPRLRAHNLWRQRRYGADRGAAAARQF